MENTAPTGFCEKLAKVMADGIDDWVCGGRM